MSADIEIAEDLAEKGWSVRENWLERSLCENLVRGAQNARAEFSRARVGQANGVRLSDEIRRDEIRWIDPSTADLNEIALLERFEKLRSALNRELFAGLSDFEAHFAVYPPGSFYRKHIDRFRADDARTVSAVLYLNDAWIPTDGGQLVLHPSKSAPVSVEPKLGSLAIFLSANLEHEVLETSRERWSIATWFRRGT